MSIEIELKVWVENPEALRKTLDSRLAPAARIFEKDDTYWQPTLPNPGIPPSGIRVRKESLRDSQGSSTRQVLVTYKTKEVREGIEVNHERELSVSDGATLEDLLRLLGLAPGIGKHKQGWAWTTDGITVELTRVSELGWFLELEILGEDDRPETVAAARRRLENLLVHLDIPQDRIEPRYYTELLAHAHLP
ncbi:MAG: CYTH domain-containing protein [Spirochaetaceae bacterium]|jgi:adenylate cyclase class 2|nr:CYTH domain-containing protein [Spirochaetaceae bacterium]